MTTPSYVPPAIGPDREDGGHDCAYTGRTPDGPICGRPATVHVLSADDKYGVVMLSTCDEHEARALAAGRWLGSHPFTIGSCDRPGVTEAHWSGT